MSDLIRLDERRGGHSFFRGVQGSDALTSLIRLTDDGVSPLRSDPLLYIRDDEAGGTTPAAVIKGKVAIGADTVVTTEKFSVSNGGGGDDIARFRGVGLSGLRITDSGSMITTGAIHIAIPMDSVTSIGSRSYCLGVHSDILVVNNKEACIVVESNNVPFLQGVQEGDTGHRIRITKAGLIGFAAGNNTAGVDDVDIGRHPSGGLSIASLPTMKLGHYGVTPVVQPAANPDTSGATLPNLEIEMNEVKQLLRDLGLMAT